jgi:hypothetical protein
MGNKKDTVWVMEIFESRAKSKILKVYEFATMGEMAYVLNMKPSVVYNFYHQLIHPRDTLNFVNIYQRKIIC